MNADAAKAALDRLSGGPGKARALPVDIGADSAGESIVSACVDAFRRIDVLVKDAGIFPQVPVLQMTPEPFDRV